MRDIKVDKIFAEILDCKIKTSKELDRRLSLAHLMRAPLYEWKEVYKDEIRENEVRIKNLKGRRENYYLFIVGLVVSIVSISLFGRDLDPISTTVGALLMVAIVITTYFILQIGSKIRAAEFLRKEWYPYIVVKETAKPENY